MKLFNNKIYLVINFLFTFLLLDPIIINIVIIIIIMFFLVYNGDVAFCTGEDTSSCNVGDNSPCDITKSLDELNNILNEETLKFNEAMTEVDALLQERKTATIAKN